jgi:hypothetical protein
MHHPLMSLGKADFHALGCAPGSWTTASKPSQGTCEIGSLVTELQSAVSTPRRGCSLG